MICTAILFFLYLWSGRCNIIYVYCNSRLLSSSSLSGCPRTTADVRRSVCCVAVCDTHTHTVMSWRGLVDPSTGKSVSRWIWNVIWLSLHARCSSVIQTSNRKTIWRLSFESSLQSLGALAPVGFSSPICWPFFLMFFRSFSIHFLFHLLFAIFSYVRQWIPWNNVVRVVHSHTHTHNIVARDENGNIHKTRDSLRLCAWS